MASTLGIDVGKFECHAALLDGAKTARKIFPNSRAGFEQLLAWLRNRKVETLHVCMEATGGLSEALAVYLIQAGHTVSIANPSRVKAFGQSELARTKTDKVDAMLIARFCIALRPEPWQPPAPEIRALQALLRRLETLEEIRLQELNRLDAPLITDDIRRSILEVTTTLEAQIKTIEKEIAKLFDDHSNLRANRDLLVSIPGIGAKTAARILGEMPNVNQFRNSGAAVAYAGLCPAERQSGTLKGRTRLSKIGNSRLRKYLYMPAVVAMRFNPVLKAMTQRLLDRGKPKMVIIGALMRKLVALAYAILRSGEPYNAALSMAR